jgi:glycosyltransferase involved in cell wall biosynthesis
MTISTAIPTVSVVMPVHNTEAFLSDAIDSILAQTFTDWELICVDDGSSDCSLAVLRRYERADSRIRVVSRPKTGVARARNDGMALGRGRYIAAMDSDDVALPERLCRQVDYMESHPDCVGLGAAVRIVGPDLMPIKEELPPLDHETIDRQALAGNGASIRQPVAIFRTDAVRQVGGYRDELLAQEDTDLYLRLAEIGRLANLPDLLLLYRQRQTSFCRARRTLVDQNRPKVIYDARIRRGLPVCPETVIWQQVSIQSDDRRGIWASWSRDAFNCGYPNTARRYAWRAIRSEPLAISSWKALLRPVFRQAMRGKPVYHYRFSRRSGRFAKRRTANRRLFI